MGVHDYSGGSIVRRSVLWHVRAAIGGPFGVLNILVGSVSIYRQVAKAFQLGLSDVLRSIFATYVTLFHGMIDTLSEILSGITGYALTVPDGFHDWIVLWFVFAGAAFRLFRAATSVQFELGLIHGPPVTPPPGLVLRWLVHWHQADVGHDEPERHFLLEAAYNLAAYVTLLCLWPLVLIEVTLFSTRFPTVGRSKPFRKLGVSYEMLFWLQSMATAFAILGLSALNSGL